MGIAPPNFFCLGPNFTTPVFLRTKKLSKFQIESQKTGFWAGPVQFFRFSFSSSLSHLDKTCWELWYHSFVLFLWQMEVTLQLSHMIERSSSGLALTLSRNRLWMWIKLSLGPFIT